MLLLQAGLQTGPTPTEFVTAAIAAVSATAAIFSMMSSMRTARRALTQQELKDSMRLTLDDFSRSEALKNAIGIEIGRFERSQSAAETLQLREAIASALSVHEKNIIDAARQIFVDERVHALDLEILRKEDVAIRALMGDLSHTSKRHTQLLGMVLEAMVNRGIPVRPKNDENEETIG